MKKFTGTVILVLFISGRTLGQYIISGQTGADDIYTDIIPNSILEGKMIPNNNGDIIIKRIIKN